MARSLRIVGFLAALGVAALLWRAGTGVETVAAAACGDPATLKAAPLNFSLKNLDGASVSMASFKGKVVLLDFWATWCGPCKYEIPGFIDLYNRYKGQGLEVVGVALDDDTSVIKPYATKMRMNYTVLIGTGEEAFTEAYGPLFGIPTTFLITRDGKICKRHIGMTTKEAFESEIKKLL